MRGTPLYFLVEKTVRSGETCANSVAVMVEKPDVFSVFSTIPEGGGVRDRSPGGAGSGYAATVQGVASAWVSARCNARRPR